jgi:hypothetical protein
MVAGTWSPAETAHLLAAAEHCFRTGRIPKTDLPALMGSANYVRTWSQISGKLGTVTKLYRPNTKKPTYTYIVTGGISSLRLPQDMADTVKAARRLIARQEADDDAANNAPVIAGDQRLGLPSVQPAESIPTLVSTPVHL